MNQISVFPRHDEVPFRDLLEQHGSPLLVLDCAALRQRYRELCQALPGVELFFAIKSLPERSAVMALAQEGAGFDVATSGELELLRSIGVNPLTTIHTHPIKRDADIRDALQFGCNTFVVDNIDELLKFKAYASRVEILLRVSFRNREAASDLSRKFGCSVRDVPFLLTEAAKHGIRIKGLSFHVGSQSLNNETHVAAVKSCEPFFRESHGLGAAPLEVLDIGGGFPVDYEGTGVDLMEFCRPIRDALRNYPEHVRVLAEPGRVLSAPCITSISTIMGRAERGGLWWYYLDDGVYGAYSGQIYDHQHYPLTFFSDDETRRESVLAGPTCDSIDVITEQADLPPLNIGDIVVGKQMGAYTIATASEFNSIPKPRVLAINEEDVSEARVRFLQAEFL